MKVDLWPVPPSMALSVIALLLFSFSAVFHLHHIFKSKTYLGRFIPFVIGAVFQVLGYIARIYSSQNEYEVGPYVASALFILLAPLFYAASIYGILEKIIDYTKSEKLMPIKPATISKLFITSDVVAFFIQSGGGGLQTSSDENTRNIAIKTVLLGLGIQILFFLFFVYLTVLLDWRTRFQEITIYMNDWRRLLRVLELSTIFIVIRSIYRIAEYADGFGGYIMNHEVYFYVFDTLMMLTIQILYSYVYPAHILKDKRTHGMA